ncbi:MAG: HesA/MoeB/ThiF family protein [Polaribacter sp.]
MKFEKTPKSYNQLFKRQITLAEIGEEGQQRLQDASVVVVGCGGLGGTIAVYLASSGVGKIHLIDFDDVDASNLHRQVFYSLDDVGKPKSEMLTNFIQQRTLFTEVSYSHQPLLKSNAKESLSGFDIIVDATDSLPTKYLLNDVAVLLNKPLVYGSLYKFDGYVSVFNISNENGHSANLRDAFPTMNTDIPNCEEAGTLNAIVGMIATAQVNEVLKLISGVGQSLKNELLIYNSLQNSFLKMKLKSKFSKEDIQQIFNAESYLDVTCLGQNEDWQIRPEELRVRLANRKSENLEIIAVLQNLKLPFEVDKTLPIQNFTPEQLEINLNKTYVMVCQKGFNSYKATQMVREKYPEVNVLNLSGGIENY